MAAVSHGRPSWLDMQLTDFAGAPRHAVTTRTEYRPASAVCGQCGSLEPDPESGPASGLRVAARKHTAETGHAVTLSSGERVTVFEVPPAGTGADPLGTLDMFADLA